MSWSSLIDGYARSEDFSESARVWNHFQGKGLAPYELIA